MEALPYNRALCERNVGNEATSIPKCASPDLWGPPGSSVLTLPSNHSDLPRDLHRRRPWPGDAIGTALLWRKSTRLLRGPRFHPAGRQIQGVRAWSQKLCHEKYQKLIHIQHAYFLFTGRRRETELTTGIDNFGCWNRELEATPFLKRENSKSSSTPIWSILIWYLGTHLFYQVCPLFWSCPHKGMHP